MQPQDPQSTPTREQQILEYVRALDEGDADTLAALLAAAETDPELDRLISEANQEVYEAAGLSPLAADAERVRELLRLHLPSGFPQPPARPLTVGDVAARLVAKGRVAEADRPALQVLLGWVEPLPERLDRQAIARLAGGAEDVSDRLWRGFREAAVTAVIGRAYDEAQLAAARQTYYRTTRESSPGFEAREPADIDAAVQRVFAAAGRQAHLERARVVPLDDLIASYPLRVAEVPGLTWQSAAAFLSAELGRPVTLERNDRQRLSGFLYCGFHGRALHGLILVDQREPVARRRFSAAHELGHYVLHFEPLVASGRLAPAPGLTVSEGLAYSEARDDGLPLGILTLDREPLAALGSAAEEEANAFAADTLMPAGAVSAALAQLGSPRANVAVNSLASRFLVSREAMRRRLRDLGLVGDVDGKGEA